MAMRLFLEWPFLYQSIRSFLDAMDITRGQRRQEEEIDRSISEPVKVSKWKWHQYQSLWHSVELDSTKRSSLFDVQDVMEL